MNNKTTGGNNTTTPSKSYTGNGGKTTTVGKTTTIYDKYANSTAVPSNINYPVIKPESHPCKYLADISTDNKKEFDIALATVLLVGRVDDIIELANCNNILENTDQSRGQKAAMLLMMFNVIKNCYNNTKAETRRYRVIYTVRACRRVAIFMLDHADPAYEGYDLELPANIIKDIIDIIDIYYNCTYDDNKAIRDRSYDNNSLLVETLVCNNLNFHDCVINEIYRYTTDET